MRFKIIIARLIGCAAARTSQSVLYVQRLRGGALSTTVVGSVVFGGASGSAVANASALGATCIPHAPGLFLISIVDQFQVCAWPKGGNNAPAKSRSVEPVDIRASDATESRLIHCLICGWSTKFLGLNAWR
jgi:tripartite ATP-independent transporter DctM subunit